MERGEEIISRQFSEIAEVTELTSIKEMSGILETIGIIEIPIPYFLYSAPGCSSNYQNMEKLDEGSDFDPLPQKWLISTVDRVSLANRLCKGRFRVYSSGGLAKFSVGVASAI